MAVNSELAQVNETLYKNIAMLTYLHPPHPEFRAVFKKDMFTKSNKTAFIHLVYYLLHTLDPSVIKEKISSWPILDVSYERTFRSEVVRYLNELNDIYPNANIPSIMSSQLVSPGGFRFAKYMLKLSLLVLEKWLSKNCDMRKEIMNPQLQTSKNGSNPEQQIKRLNKLTKHVNRETERSMLNFHNNFVKLKDEAEIVVNKLNKAQKNINTLQSRLEISDSLADRQEFNKKYEGKIKLLNENLSKIKDISDILRKIEDKLENITKANLTLRSTTGEELDLFAVFKNFNLQMENHCLEMTIFTELELEDYINKFMKCNEEFGRLKDNLKNIQKQWMNLSVDVKNVRSQSESCKKLIHNTKLFPVPFCSGDSTILATPLDVSESI